MNKYPFDLNRRCCYTETDLKAAREEGFWEGYETHYRIQTPVTAKETPSTGIKAAAWECWGRVYDETKPLYQIGQQPPDVFETIIAKHCVDKPAYDPMKVQCLALQEQVRIERETKDMWKRERDKEKARADTLQAELSHLRAWMLNKAEELLES